MNNRRQLSTNARLITNRYYCPFNGWGYLYLAMNAIRVINSERSATIRTCMDIGRVCSLISKFNHK